MIETSQGHFPLFHNVQVSEVGLNDSRYQMRFVDPERPHNKICRYQSEVHDQKP